MAQHSPEQIGWIASIIGGLGVVIIALGRALANKARRADRTEFDEAYIKVMEHDLKRLTEDYLDLKITVKDLAKTLQEAIKTLTRIEAHLDKE